MKIAPKIVLLFLPILVGSMIFVAVSASVSARGGITDVAASLLQFKAEELGRYALSQYELLRENDLLGDEMFIDASKQSIASHADGLVRQASELVFAVDDNGRLPLSTGELELTDSQREWLIQLVEERAGGWQELTLGDTRRVAHVVPFSPFGWSFFVTNEATAFYGPLETIYLRSGIILAASIVLTTLLVILFSSYITRPIKQTVQAMRNIVETGELSRRVEVRLNDETGELGDNFNRMTSALEHAWTEIKSYAFQTAVAQRRESKIRNIFQKYVPAQVIEQFFTSPESMLVGQDRELAILFSDIRGFSALSEGLEPRSVVESLNRYFSRMVEVVMQQQGVVDKYIGDALMAFFGAPAPDQESCFHAVSAALNMIDNLDDFNSQQSSHGRPVFSIGVGINYGGVTIGNIGSEQKMEYTVIGDMVNLASRLEGLTKPYQQPIIISDSVQKSIDGRFPCRMLDRVVVKGKSNPVVIYSVQRALSEEEQEAWKLHHEGLEHYYDRRFDAAKECFERVLEAFPNDRPASIFLQRSDSLRKAKVPDTWTGVFTISDK